MPFIEPPFWARTWRTYPRHVAIKAVVPDTEPAEPLDVLEARAHLGQSLTDDDDLIGRYISSARAYLENRIQKPLRPTEADLFFDAAGAGQWITLPAAPLISVDEIATTDTDDVETVVATSVYLVDDASQPARIGLKSGQYWPVNLRYFRAVRVRLTLGFVPVPEDLIQAMRLLVAHYYENRVAAAPAAGDLVELGVADLVAPYELVVLG